MYLENPKTKGSGIMCAIPQAKRCPIKCPECFFNSGRSYLEPLDQNLPNMPDPEDIQRNGSVVVRVNDGNDSSIEIDEVLAKTSAYPLRFFNTIFPVRLDKFPGPVVLTINPGAMTDSDFHRLLDYPRNLMFVRFRTNAWNLPLADKAVAEYVAHEIPVVLTFMAYHGEASIPEAHRPSYVYRKRTQNSYWAITTAAWREVMRRHEDNPWVHSCGKIEGEKGKTGCRWCGNCLREFFATRTRMGKAEN